jgi:glycosyltransferase involved in cell wall biosynthesis
LAFSWWPDPSGGTEVYVRGLAEELSNLGVENVIAAPKAGLKEVESFKGADGIRVWRFGCKESGGDLGEIYGEGDPVAAESFKRVLDGERPDIVHFHAWSPAVSILLVREVKHRGIRVAQTYHTPTLSCPRGTLMRWGKIVCDGDLAKRPCALCAIHGKLRKGYRISDMGYGKDSGGVSRKNPPNPESQIRNAQSPTLQTLVSKLTTMFRMTGLIRKSISGIRESFDAADRIVALNQWSYDLLARNGVPKEKLRIIRHGVPSK